MSIHAIKKLLL